MNIPKSDFAREVFMQRVSFVAAGFLVLATPLSAFADLGPMPGEENFKTMLPDQQKQNIGAELGFAAIDEDFFLQLTLKSELNLGPVGLGLQIPLNLRVWDRDPKAKGDYYGLIRKEDWDEPAEFAKVIRYLRLGHKRDSFYLRAGEIAARLGHGTIMDRYLNNLDANTFAVGTEFDINTDYGGFETVVSNIGALYDFDTPRTRLLGARAYFKPYALVDPDSMFNIFAIGTTVVSDTNAPRTIATDPADPTKPLIDDKGNLKVANDTAATVWGIDAEAQVMHNALLDIIPYTDLNFIQQAGWGWHAGVMVTAKMPVGFDLTMPVRLEYRRFRSDYIPIYFGTFYDIERMSYPVGESNPKARAVRQLASNKGLNGYYGDLAFDFAGIFQLGAVYEDYEGGNPNLQAFLAVPALETFQFKAFYARTDITGTGDIFKLDNRSMAVVQGRYQLVSYVYLVGRLTRRWELESDPGKAKYGQYVGSNEWKFGLETSLEF